MMHEYILAGWGVPIGTFWALRRLSFACLTLSFPQASCSIWRNLQPCAKSLTDGLSSFLRSRSTCLVESLRRLALWQSFSQYAMAIAEIRLHIGGLVHTSERWNQARSLSLLVSGDCCSGGGN